MSNDELKMVAVRHQVEIHGDLAEDQSRKQLIASLNSVRTWLNKISILF